MKKFFKGFVATILVSLCGVWTLAAYAATTEVTLDEVRGVYSTASAVEALNDGVFAVKSGEAVLGYAVTTAPFSDSIFGYNGPVASVVCFDPSWRIVKVVPSENVETPRFFESVVNGGLFDAWNGLSPAEAAKKEVDAVSGATYSSEAAIKSVKKRMAELDRLGYGDNGTCSVVWIGVAVLLLCAVCGFLYVKRKK